MHTTHPYPWLRVLLGIPLGYLLCQAVLSFFLSLNYLGGFSDFVTFLRRAFAFSPFHLSLILNALWLIYRRAERNHAGIAQAFITAFLLALLFAVISLIQLPDATDRQYLLAMAIPSAYTCLKHATLVAALSWWVLPADDNAQTPPYPAIKVIVGFTLLGGLLTALLYFLLVLFTTGHIIPITSIFENIRTYLYPALILSTWAAWRGLHCNARHLCRMQLVALIPLVLYFTYHSLNNIYLGGGLYALAAAYLVCLRPALAILILAFILLPRDDASPQNGKGYAALFIGMLTYTLILLIALIAATLLFFYLLAQII